MKTPVSGRLANKLLIVSNLLKIIEYLNSQVHLKANIHQTEIMPVA
jgi:hypothetical protein